MMKTMAPQLFLSKARCVRGLLGLLAGAALAVPAQAAGFDGSQLAAWWAIPFIGILLSIAIWPLAGPHFWHHHFGKISAAWSLAFLLPFAWAFGLHAAGAGLVHALVAEYIPFILLLTALFTVSGGIFFIFIVSNIGGSLTPLGDPPLFLGFLKGVTFFWTVDHVWRETLFLVVVLLALFYVLDSWLYRREGVTAVDPTPDNTERFGFDGAANFVLLGAVVALVLTSGIWQPGIAFDVAGTVVELPSLVRDAGMVVVTLISLAITPGRVHEANQFSWGPMQEVAKLFAGIFLTIIPVIAMLQAGMDGPFGAVVRAVTNADGTSNPAMYFWATGVLSAFLDNAPTYLVFFNTAGGQAAELMGPLADTLAAISAGAVFMGAITYIGNAPNLMVKAIAEDQNVKMPSFFGYMLWSCGILLPLFALLTWMFFI